jgi:tetratricopeptide (TPR) repeat protein
MRGATPTVLLLVALLPGCWFGTPAQPDGAPAPPAASAGAPTWVPALTAQQQALLKPVEHAVKARADRVYPDLARFGYAKGRPLASGEDAVKFTRMVTQVLNDSPRFYTLDEAPPEAANGVAQYGPTAGDPDGYVVLKRGSDPLRAELVPAPGADEARAAVSEGDKLAASGDLAGAIAAYRAGVAKAPGVPALRVALAAALLKAGKANEAETAYREAASVDPSYAPAQLGLAEIAVQRGDLAAARRALVEALAYHPPSQRGLELAQRIGGGGSGGRAPQMDGGWTDAPPPPARGGGASARVQPFAIFLDVDDAGAIHVGTAKTDAAQIYGGCRAVVRYEPDVRAQLFQIQRETPYYLSTAEEVVCLEAAVGAYLAAKSNGAPASPDLEELYRIATEEGLSGYAMFEILGQHRADRMRTAPVEVHQEVASYVERHVLGGRPKAAPAAPEGVYTAAR